MAWNEPGNGQRDPWKKKPRGTGGTSKLPAVLRDLLRPLGRLGGPGGVFTILGVFVLAWLLMTSYAVIGPGQIGVVQRFGAYARTLGPGFHIKLPLPVETVQTVAISRVRAMSDQVHMLTSDQDIVEVDFNVQYQISDAQQYLYAGRDPDGTLNEAAQSAVSAVIGAQPMQALLTTQADAGSDTPPALLALQNQVRDQLQKLLDSYRSGLSVTDVSFQAISPPPEVKDAFDDVAAARQDVQGLLDQAHASTSQDVPDAKADAQRLAADADAYKTERIARAQGDTQRFELILKEYKAAPDLTRRRLWLEAMEDILRANHSVIDGSDGHSVINVGGDAPATSTSLPGVGVAAPATDSDQADKGKQP